MYRWFHQDGFKKDKHKVTVKMTDMTENLATASRAWMTDKDTMPVIPVGDLTADNLKCKCPVCTYVKTNNLFHEYLGTDSEAGTLVSLHNLWFEIDLDKNIYDMAQNKPEELFDFLWETYGKKKQYNNILRFMKEYYYTDLEKFINKHPYNNKFNGHRNIELESWLGAERTNLRMAEDRLQKGAKVKKQKKKKGSKIEIVKDEPEYKEKDEDWVT